MSIYNIIVNGKKYTGNRSISINNNKVIINGKDITPDSKKIDIVINGNVEESLNIDCCDKIKITDDVGKVSSQSGDISIKGNVTGDVKSMSGDIKGNVRTMSEDIRRK